MKIASFNINGIKARLPRLLEWLETTTVDVVCLQEIKSTDEAFPRDEIEAAGWHIETCGQKAFNGVALLSRHPLSDVKRGLPGMNKGPEKNGETTPEQARYIEATIKGVHIASLYLPNGNPQPGPKFDYKLTWMTSLLAHAGKLIAEEKPVVLAGDYNIIPDDIDCYDPPAFADDALTHPEARGLMRSIIHLGYTDALRQIKPDGPAYTYWDYQRGAWPKDNGLRIDHLLLSPEATDRLTDCQIDRLPRGLEKSSDHTPIWIELNQ